MAKLTLSPIGSFTQSAVTTINQNMDLIESAVEKTLSRDGTIPNQMTSDFDMNHNDILNVDNIDANVIEVAHLILDGSEVVPADSLISADEIMALISIDEDNMISNRDDKVPTQQSVKAYVDASISENSNIFSSKAEASLFNPITAPDKIFLTGFNTANEFGFIHPYIKSLVNPNHGGAFQTADGTWWEPDVDSFITPDMYGGSVADTLAKGILVRIPGKSYSIPAPISVQKPNLTLIADPGAVLTFTGVADSNYAIEIWGSSRVSISGPGELNCDQKCATGIIIRAEGDAPYIKVDGWYVLNPFQSGAATYDACGIALYATTTGAAFIGSVTNCRIYNVDRDKTSGISVGIVIAGFITSIATGNTINGVSRFDGFDADGIKVFGHYTGTAYVESVALIADNIIDNCEGRFIKTQTKGPCTIRNNLMRFTAAVDLYADAALVDVQVDGAAIYDNRIELTTAWTGGADMIAVAMRTPAVTPDYTGQLVAGSVRNNTIIVAAGAPDLERGLFIDISSLSSNAYAAFFDVDDNLLTTTSGLGAVTAALIGFSILNPISFAAGATASIRARRNHFDASNFCDGLQPCGGTAAHGGLGDLTGKLYLEFIGNVDPLMVSIPIMSFDTNDCFTSSFRIQENSIGTEANWWQAPFDFKYLLGGNDLFIASAVTPAHANAPTAYTSSLVRKNGRYSEVLYSGGVPTNISLSLHAIGSVPSWF